MCKITKHIYQSIKCLCEDKACHLMLLYAEFVRVAYIVKILPK